jgi:hypothetical protein
MRRLNFTAEACDVRVSHVIGDDEEDVGLLFRSVTGGGTEKRGEKNRHAVKKLIRCHWIQGPATVVLDIMIRILTFRVVGFG